MPDRVVAAVERMAQEEQQPLVGHGAPLFEWTPGVPIQDDVHTPIIQNKEQTEIIEVDDYEPAELDPMVGEDPNEQDEPEDIDGEDNPAPEDLNVDPRSAQDDTKDDEPSDNDYDPNSDPNSEELRSITDPNGQHEETDKDKQMIVAKDACPEDIIDTGSRHHLRPKRTRDYSHHLGHIMDEPASSTSYDAQFFQQEQVLN
jgi:hypothetical protein